MIKLQLQRLNRPRRWKQLLIIVNIFLLLFFTAQVPGWLSSADAASRPGTGGITTGQAGREGGKDGGVVPQPAPAPKETATSAPTKEAVKATDTPASSGKSGKPGVGRQGSAAPLPNCSPGASVTANGGYADGTITLCSAQDATITEIVDYFTCAAGGCPGDQNLGSNVVITCVSGCTGSFVVDQSENVDIPITGGVELEFTYHVIGPVQPCIDGGGTERSAKSYVEFSLDTGQQYHACGASVHISGATVTPTATDTPAATCTVVPTDTPTPTCTTVPTDTPTPTCTTVPSDTPSATPSRTGTPTRTGTATRTGTSTGTPTNTNTRTLTGTSTPT